MPQYLWEDGHDRVLSLSFLVSGLVRLVRCAVVGRFVALFWLSVVWVVVLHVTARRQCP